MLFSGYQLGVHLLNSTFAKISLKREEAIKYRQVIKVTEKYLNQNLISRNSVFIVEGPFKDKKNTTFFVKQPRFDDSNYISSILNEKYILEIFRDSDITNLNLLEGFDQYQYLLFIKFVVGESFDVFALPQEKYLKVLLKDLGDNFSKIHSITSNSLKSSNYPDKFGYRKPVFFAFAKRDFDELLINGNSKELLSVVNVLKKDNYKLLDLIKSFGWNQDTLIHFDFKFEHLILTKEGNTISIVDWEMADMGDIYWDIASVWYEIIHPFISLGEVDSLITSSINYLNVFFSNYSQKIDLLKLQRFLGIIIFHKHFYRLFDKGFKGGITEKWIQKAEDLILSVNPIFVPADYNVNAPNIILNYNQEGESANHSFTDNTFNERSAIGSRKEIEEISHKIYDEYKKSPPNPLKLSEFIYSWFNGSLENPKDLSRKEVIAESPKVGNEIMSEDFWWQVEGYSKNNSVIIRKESERRVAEPGGFIYLNHHPNSIPSLSIKSYVKLQSPKYIVRPNDARPDSNDLWVFSDQQIRQDYSNWIRFYFNLQPKVEGINIFIDNITAKLNERCIPFELKLRNALSSYTRTDVAILFVHRQHFNACLDSIAYVYKILIDGEYLGTGTPKFTKVFKTFKNNKKIIFDGLAFAENPTEHAESFGNWRAKLIEKIIYDNWNSLDNENKIKYEIERKLKEKGFNIYELYRNPYPEKNEYKYRYDLLEGKNNKVGKLENPPLLDSGIISSLKYLPSQRFLKAARKIAFIVCREAVWYGNYCTWFAFKKNKKGEAYFETVNDSEILGICLFLCQMWILSPNDPIFKDCTLGILHGFNLSERNENDSEKCLTKIITLLKANPLSPVPSTSSNNHLGAIEIAELYKEEFIESQKKSKFLADVLIEKYVDKKIPLPNGYSDNWSDLNGTEFNPTVTHGIAGLGYFFLTLIDNKDHPIEPLKTFFIKKS
jgi:HopA1 effector protein family/Phosphotransferase enzyme family